MVAGEPNRGKSSLLNALLGETVVPTGAMTATGAHIVAPPRTRARRGGRARRGTARAGPLGAGRRHWSPLRLPARSTGSCSSSTTRSSRRASSWWTRRAWAGSAPLTAASRWRPSRRRTPSSSCWTRPSPCPNRSSRSSPAPPTGSTASSS